MTTTHTPSADEPLHIGGIGLPMIDFITKATGEKKSTRDELTAGFSLIQEAKAKHQDDSTAVSNASKVALFETREEGEQHIQQALEAFDKFEAFIAERGYKPKEKRPLSAEDDKQVAQWFGAIIRAAIDINRAAEFVGKPDQALFIRHMGGTTYNKLHGLQMGLGDRVKTHLLGALGDKDEGLQQNHGLVTMNLKEFSKIDFQQLDNLSLGNMAIGYIWQKDGDRLAMSSCTPELLPHLTETHLKQISSFADQPPLDMYLVEGGDFGKNKFGDKAFAAFEERALSSGKPIMLGLPTNMKLIQSDIPDEVVEKNRERLFRLIDAPNTPFIGSNEEEAVAMFCNEKLCKKGPETEGWRPQEIEKKAKEQIKEACNRIQERLKKKAEKLGPDEVEPLAFVSNGVKGVYAITQDKIQLVPGNKHPELVNNIGAGDGLFAGSLIYYINHVTRPLNGTPPLTHFSEKNLKEMFTMGQNVSYHIVGQKGAQLHQGDMMKAIHGEDHGVPTNGALAGATPHQQPNIYRGIA